MPHDVDQLRTQSGMIETGKGVSRADERGPGTFVEKYGWLVIVGVAIDQAIQVVEVSCILVEIPGPWLRKPVFALRDGGDRSRT